MHPGLPLGLSLFIVACSSAPSAPSAPISTAPAAPVLPSRAVFSEEVLAPLSKQIADSRIDQAKAEVDANKGVGLLPLLGSIFGPGGAVAGQGLEAMGNASIEQTKARLEARRHPLAKELREIFEGRIENRPTGYAVCVEGKKRVYQAQGGQWLRLDDEPATCPTVPVTTLKEEPRTVTK